LSRQGHGYDTPRGHLTEPPRLRDARELLAPAIEETIDALMDKGLGPEDAAAVKLARRYADVIDTHKDQAWAIRWIGPLLLDVLESLGATPAVRAKQKGGPVPNGENRLQALRAARRA